MSFVSKFLAFILSLFFAYASSSFSSKSNVFLIPLPKGPVGPVSIAFDPLGGGPYTGIDDGRILKYDASTKWFKEFASSNMKRPRKACDGVLLSKLPESCGRPLGLSFNDKTGDLYFADAVYGLSTVNGTAGGVGKQLATAAECRPFFLLTSVVADVSTGDIYSTDYSRIFNLRNISISTRNTDATGRLIKYNWKTKQTTVLLEKDLHGAAGVAISNDSSFLIVSELITGRLRKYWLKGRKANTTQIINHFDGCPTEIKRSTDGNNFWVGVNFPTNKNKTMFTSKAFKLDASGKVIQTVDVSKEFSKQIVTVVQEHKGKLYVGSFGTQFIGVYPLKN